jgi:hypothetical protein
MRKVILSSLILSSLLFCHVTIALSDTPVGGTCTGTWDLAGSPYLVTQDCVVPRYEKLTIKPGVTVIVGDNLSINVTGQLLAEGTQSQHITFTSPNESTTWNRIYFDSYGITFGSPASRFKYCDFSNAHTAIHMYVQGRHSDYYSPPGMTEMQIEISSCTFSDLETAIFGHASGRNRLPQDDRFHARLDPVIEKCVFDGTDQGIELFIDGNCVSHCGGAYSDAVIENCIFNDIPGFAFNMRDPVDWISASAGNPVFTNNTIIGCNQGVFVSRPFDGEIRNNIFYGNTLAVQRTGSTSETVYYNCFFNNVTDFDGYPSSYGDVCCVNANGDPCDIGFNIFMDPLFVSVVDPHLTLPSPCIDAGTDEEAPNDDIDGHPRPMRDAYDIGVDEYPCDCIDNDGDGFGSPACISCPDRRLDCDDDTSDDPIEVDCATCTCGEIDCSPACAKCIHPGDVEGPAGDPTCSDGIDNDCDHRIDHPADSDCPWDLAGAQTSTVEPKSLVRSGAVNRLAFLLLPLAAILILRIVRRNK